MFHIILYFKILYFIAVNGRKAGGSAVQNEPHSMDENILDFSHEIFEIRTRLANQQSQITQQEMVITQLKDENAKQEATVLNLKEEMADQNAVILELTLDNVRLTTELERLNSNVEEVLLDSRVENHALPDTRTQFTAFSCIYDVMTVSCPDNRTILTTSAYYGMYDYFYVNCTTCCVPDPQSDCMVSMEENMSDDWLAIKELCDNQTECEYMNNGTILDYCRENYTSDYTQIFFDCLPEVDGPVGFSAYADNGNVAYSGSEVVIFDQVLSNFGGHYNPETSSFQCPYDGVYLINLNIMAYGGNYLNVAAYRNANWLSNAHAYNGNDHGTAGSLIIAPCSRGDVIWCRAGNSGVIFGTGRYNMFSAYLLYRYD